MLKPGTISERWLIISISVLMVLALAMVARILSNTKERGDRLGMLLLDRTLEGQQQRLRLVAQTYEWELMEEALHLMGTDSVEDALPLQRWMPLMRNRFAIREIALADEHGGERVLQHVDSTWQFIRSERHAGSAVSMGARWPIGRSSVPALDTCATQADPRRSNWFSRALENRQDAPLWSESEAAEGQANLHLSMLLRGSTDQEMFKVLRFSIDARDMLSAMSEPSPHVSTIVLDSKGRPLARPDSSRLGRAWHTVLRAREADHSRHTFRSPVSDLHWVGRLLPMEFNGMRIQAGALIGFEGIKRWNREGRIGLWAVLGILVLLGLMLALIFVQSRSAERRVLRQQRRSRLQARHLAQAIGEREVLDREVHHRVKNNLQVVSSLLNLQAQRVPGNEARDEFMRGKRRIDSMALVHHKLYRQQDLSAVDLGVFLDDLAKAIAAMFDPGSRNVSHSVDANGVRCDADTSIQLGMILCELLANCHQHAFPYATGGHISISVRQEGPGGHILQVKDNGKGFSPEEVLEKHLGLEVVEALAEQLDGGLRIENDGGTVAEVSFRCKGSTP